MSELELIQALRKLKRDPSKINRAFGKKIGLATDMEHKLSLAHENSKRVLEAAVYNKAIERCIKEIRSFNSILQDSYKR